MRIDEKELLEMVKEAVYVDHLEKYAGETLDKTERAIRKAREIAIKGSAMGAGAAAGAFGGGYLAGKVNPAAHPHMSKAVAVGSPIALAALAHIGKKAMEDEVSEEALDTATHGLLGGAAGMGIGGGIGHLLKGKPALGALIGGGTGTAAALLASHLLNKKRDND